MPLTVNVGLSRKSSENYQSQGLSINITAELDQSLLADPRRLQDEIDRIYAQADDALERQSAPKKPALQPARPPVPRPQRNGQAHHQRNGNVISHANGHANQGGPFRPTARQDGDHDGVPYGGPVRPATASQMRALRSLAKRLDCDLADLMTETFGIATVQTDIRQASRLIDILKERLEFVQAANGQQGSQA